MLAEVALIFRTAGACPRARRPRSAKDRLISWPLRALLFVTPPLALNKGSSFFASTPSAEREGAATCWPQGLFSRGQPKPPATAQPGTGPGSGSGRSVRDALKGAPERTLGAPSAFPRSCPPRAPRIPSRHGHSLSCHPLGPGGVVSLAVSELMMKYSGILQAAMATGNRPWREHLHQRHGQQANSSSPSAHPAPADLSARPAKPLSDFRYRHRERDPAQEPGFLRSPASMEVTSSRRGTVC